MSVDFSELRAAIRDAARAAFNEVRAAHFMERFYAFALYTDDGVMTVMPAASSEEGFRRVIKQSGETDPAVLNHYRWATAEWTYEAVGDAHFQTVYDLLNVPGRYDDDGDEDDEDAAFAAFRTRVIETMTEALHDLDAAGFFGSGAQREGVTLFVSISDSDDAVQTENESARRLNPPSAYERFATRYPEGND